MVLTGRRPLLAGLLATPWIAGTARAQTVRLRFAHPHPESDSWHKASQLFARLVRERSKGAVTVQVIGNGTLGSDPTMISMTRGGTLDIVQDGVSGVLFAEQTVDAIIRAVEQFETLHILPATTQRKAKRFDQTLFISKLRKIVSDHS